LKPHLPNKNPSHPPVKTTLTTLFAIIAWLAVLTQFDLMIENSVASVLETTIRFFSFFTILTNLLVAVYFTLSLIRQKNGSLWVVNKPGTLTAVTVYISIVGLIYQLILRHTWEPKGMQMIVDELLHTVIPVLVIVFWYLYEDKSALAYRQIPKWLIYPIVYLVYILIRGSFSNFYPYPFVDVTSLGLSEVLINSAGLIVLFVGISALYVKLGKMIGSRN
jgi:hypothetical protein